MDKRTRLKNCRDANRTNDPLGEQHLIIFCRYRSHHETKDVHQRPDQEQVARSVPIVELADDGTLEELKCQYSTTY